jgi:hypothetical protein
MGEVCSTYGMEDKCLQTFGYRTLEIGYLEDPVGYGRTILKWILKRYGIGGFWLRFSASK